MGRREGRADWLVAPGRWRYAHDHPGKRWDERRWTFDASGVTAIGFAVAMVGGAGTPSAVIREFEVYVYAVRRWWYQLVSGLLDR
jgi:hypothetical protein